MVAVRSLQLLALALAMGCSEQATEAASFVARSTAPESTESAQCESATAFDSRDARAVVVGNEDGTTLIMRTSEFHALVKLEFGLLTASVVDRKTGQRSEPFLNLGKQGFPPNHFSLREWVIASDRVYFLGDLITEESGVVVFAGMVNRGSAVQPHWVWTDPEICVKDERLAGASSLVRLPKQHQYAALSGDNKVLILDVDKCKVVHNTRMFDSAKNLIPALPDPVELTRAGGFDILVTGPDDDEKAGDIIAFLYYDESGGLQSIVARQGDASWVSSKD